MTGELLGEVFAGMTTDELRATQRLLHRVYQGARHLGWGEDVYGRLMWLPRSEPVALAAVCLEIDAEIARREAHGAPPHLVECPPCRVTVDKAVRLPVRP